MSLFETKTADNFIYEEAADPRGHISESTPFLRKNVAYVVDSQAGNGSYTSGEVIIDSQSIAASGNVIDWRNAYIAVPKQTKVENTFAPDPVSFTNAGGANIAKYLPALKNSAQLDSIKVEANGKTIITATQGLANMVNFKLLSISTQDSLQKDGAVIGFYPDDVGMVGAATTSYNAANAASTVFGDDPVGINRGLVERQHNFLPTYQTAFLTDAGIKNEGGAFDSSTAKGVFQTGTATNTLLDLHYVVIIRLRDLADYFDKHCLSRGVSYRFTLKFNQAVSTVVGVATATTTPFNGTPSSVTPQQISGSAQPAMLCCGTASIAASLTCSTGTVATLRITDQIDTTSDTRFSGVRLYVPSYELDPSHQEKLLAQPIIKKSFMDFMTQTTQTPAAAGASINVQVSTSATNPRALIVIPRWSQTATGNGGQGFYSDVSPVATVPGSTDGLLSLTNIQVKMGSNYVLPDRMFYGWQQFIDHASSIFAVNGNQTSQTSGVISKKMWEANHRYYAFDLSRYPEAMSNLPQMVSLECVNNSAVSIELLCILVYSRDVEFNLASGSMTITA